MKNLTKLLGIIVLVAVIGFAMAACEQPTSTTGKTLTGITLDTTLVKKAYTQNETLNLSGLVVTAAYSDSSSAAVTDYTTNPANGAALSTAGTITVTVSYTEGVVTKTADFSITVTAATTPTDITYSIARADGANGTADTTAINFTFSESVTGLTADDITITSGTGAVTKGVLSGSGTSWTLGVTVAAAGNLTVQITKSGIEAEPKDVTVYKAGQIAPVLDSITAVYTQGATIVYPTTPLNDLKAGLTVTATYSSGAPQQVTAYELSGTLTVGTSTVTVTFEDKTTTFDVTVTAAPSTKTLTGITLNTTSVKKVYNQNETLNLTGLVVTANYSDSTSATVSYTSTSPANGATLSTLGAITVTVSYTEGAVTKSDTFTVTVAPVNKTLTGITLDIALVKKGYYQNDTLNLTGLVVTANYSDGFSATVSNYTADPANGTTLSAIEIKTVTISYTEGTVTRTSDFIVVVIGTDGDTGDTGTPGLAYQLIYNVFNDGEFNFNSALRVRKGSVTGGAVVIPAYQDWSPYNSSYGVMPVTEIGSMDDGYDDDNYDRGAFSNTDITSITIPASVTTIGGIAFYNCTSLTSITLPASVTTIGGWAFLGCTSLTGITVDANNPNYASQDGILYNKAKTTLIQAPGGISGAVTIPAGVTSIGDVAFALCTGLTSVTIPASVTTIGGSAFNSCTSLASVTIPAGVTSIDTYAFRNCTSLTSVTIPASVTSISDLTFGYCTSLTSVTIPDSVTSIGAGAFFACTGLTSITLPAGVTSIGGSAFGLCTSLTNITIPASVTSIGGSAFLSCTSLTSITVDANNTNYASQDGILYNKAKTTLIQVPGGISGAVNIPASVTSIGKDAFASCTSLTSVTIPSSVTSIGGWAFADCTSLTSVTFEGTISSSWNGFDGYAFYELGDLRDKFYQGDSANGTPGTYTRPDGSSTTWTKQP